MIGRRTYVFGIDPGSTTGLAIAQFGPHRLTEPLALTSNQRPWDEASDSIQSALRALADRQQFEECDVVAVGEKFIVNAKTAQRGQSGVEDAMGMLGVLRYLCRVSGVTLAPLQAAQPVKNLVTDEALRAMHLYAPGMMHVNDAYRHTVFYAINNKLLHPRFLLEKSPLEAPTEPGRGQKGGKR